MGRSWRRLSEYTSVTSASGKSSLKRLTFSSSRQLSPIMAPVLGLCFVHISVSNLSRLWISHSKKSGLALITTAYRFLSLNQGNTSFSCLSQNLLTALFSGTSITKQKKYFLNVVKLIILVTSKRAIIIWNGAKTSIHG